jgi:hypothetical protein
MSIQIYVVFDGDSRHPKFKNFSPLNEHGNNALSGSGGIEMENVSKNATPNLQEAFLRLFLTHPLFNIWLPKKS